MNLKKLFSLGVVVGMFSSFGNPMISHAIEYEQEWIQSWGGSNSEYFNFLMETSDRGFLVIGESKSTDANFLNKGDSDGIIVKYSKEGNQEWVKSWGGSGRDYFDAAMQTTDGGVVVVGMSVSNDAGIEHKGNGDAIIVKYDQEGEQEWVRSWGGSYNEYFSFVIEVSDGGFVAIGNSGSSDAGFEHKMGRDAIIVKYDKDGTREWIQSFGGNNFDDFKSVIEMSDGGFLVVGESSSTDAGFENKGNSDAVVIKYSKNGDREWVQTFGGNKYDWFNSVVEVLDEGFLVVGCSQSSDAGFENQGDRDGIVVKYDKDGNQEWIQSWGGSGYDVFASVTKVLDGGFVAVGNGDSTDVGFENQGQTDGIVIKYDKGGNREWIQSWGGSGYEYFGSVEETVDGDLIVVGSKSLTGVNTDGILIKYSPKTDSDIQINGNVQTMVADITIPSVSPDLVINPNLPEGFVAPEFSVLNDSVSPIKLELKTFEQMTDAFNDVLPTKYESWVGLNKRQSQDIALGLIAKEGEGWQMLMTPTSYVANHIEHEIGVIKPASQVDFSFDVKHGTSFSEAKTVQYKMVFVFDLLS